MSSKHEVPPSKKIIYTIGTSDRLPDEFINILRHYNILQVVDVRRFPTSKFMHFRQENLEKLLIENGIQYYWLGLQLGGYRSGGYQKYMETKEFREGISKLLEFALKFPTVIMCAERLPWRCHRRYVGDYLVSKGYKIVHIIDEKRIWEPKSIKR